MWLNVFYIVFVILEIYIAFTTIYFLVLAVAYFILPEPKNIEICKSNRFAVIVPAHNEELLISTLCESLLLLNYPSSLYTIFIVADNCTDQTSEVCSKYTCEVLIRDDEVKRGKGYAIAWALNQVPLDDYDAVLIVDADNYVDCNLLLELNKILNSGEHAIQCCNSVGNRNDSWFTQLLFVTRTINNLLYHHSKYKLGLSSYLMGNGICFTTELIKKKGWTAFTIGEDWEYYAQLLDEKIRIAFAVHAKVFHQESKSLNQATSQRLRWSSGRFYVAKSLGLQLLMKGIRRFDGLLMDASLPLLLPNYSLLLNLSLITLFVVFIVSVPPYHDFMLFSSLVILFGQFMLLLLGIILSGEAINIIKALFFAPIFLIWKMVIDVITITGIYRGEKWVRTKRHISK